MAPPTFGERLQAALDYAGKSQSDLARAIGKKPQAVQYLCTPRARSSRYTTEIARALGVSADWLATGKGEMLPKRGQSEPTLAVEERRGTYARRSADEYPPDCMEAARLLAAIAPEQRRHLVEAIRMVHTATLAISTPEIAAILSRVQDQERQEFYNKWIEQKQAEYRARDAAASGNPKERS